MRPTEIPDTEIPVTADFDYHSIPAYAVLQIDWQLGDGWEDYSTIRTEDEKRIAYNHVLSTPSFRIRNQEGCFVLVNPNLSDGLIMSAVESAAYHVCLHDKDLVLAVEEILFSWIKTEAIQSLGYRVGNMTIIVGAIAEAINE